MLALFVISAIVVLSCGGFGFHLLGTSGTAQCAGQRMQPTDICRDLTHGTQKTYDQSLHEQTSAVHLFGWVFVIGAVVALVIGIGCLVAALPKRRTGSATPAD
jgi:hypothetical protein